MVKRIFRGTPIQCVECGNTFYKILRIHKTTTKRLCDECIRQHKLSSRRKYLARQRLIKAVESQARKKSKTQNPKNIHYPPDFFKPR